MDGVGSVETVSEHGPVLEEFMPLKPSLSLSSSDEEHESTHATAVVTNGVEKKEEADTPDMRSPSPGTKKAMPDWLQSVQLWCQEPPQQPSSLRKVYTNKEAILRLSVWDLELGSNRQLYELYQQELPCKPVALSSRNAGGAFQPFEKEKRAELPASSTTAAASSAVVGDSGDKASIDTEKHSDKEINKDAKDRGKDKDKEGQSQPSNRKPRRCWAPELHRRFLQALQQLGGSHGWCP